MSETWIVNASPIIVLAKIGRLDLLAGTGRSLIIPDAVSAEILRGPPDDPARKAIESGWGGKPRASDPIDRDVMEWGLGQGETAVLSVALRERGVAVVDDKAARIACAAIGIRVIGALGVVLVARREGLISSAVETMRALRDVGMRLNDVVIRRAMLEMTGEVWPNGA